MKIIITGSLGNISKPLSQQLIQQGHSITIISSSADKKEEIESLGATAAIGSLEDADFLKNTFSNADSVYCMIPPNYHSLDIDPIAFYKLIGEKYFEAIIPSNIKHVVHLSSIGGNMTSGSGQLLGHHEVETIFKQLPAHITVTTLRPVGFYNNLLNFIPGIIRNNMMSSNYGEKDIIPWVATSDIASVAAEELNKSIPEQKVRYIVSDEMSCDETATILGTAIGKPDLKWMLIPRADVINRMKNAGMPEKYATLLTEMNETMHEGGLQEDYIKHRPEHFGKTKMHDFAKTFVEAFAKAQSDR